jgi:hypothetical protein
MAQKLQLLKLLQEIRGFADVGNRSTEFRPLLQASMDLRAPNQPTCLPVRRFSIPVTHEHHEESASEIPITPVADLTAPAQRVTRVVLRSA